jgi:hypothetical protein
MAGFRKITSLLGTFDAHQYDTYEYTTPIVDMAVYLPWLTRMFLSLGMIPLLSCVCTYVHVRASSVSLVVALGRFDQNTTSR